MYTANEGDEQFSALFGEKNTQMAGIFLTLTQHSLWTIKLMGTYWPSLELIDLKETSTAGTWAPTRNSGAMSGLFCHYNGALEVTNDDNEQEVIAVPEKNMEGTVPVSTLVIQGDEMESWLIKDSMHLELLQDLGKFAAFLGVTELERSLQGTAHAPPACVLCAVYCVLWLCAVGGCVLSAV